MHGPTLRLPGLPPLRIGLGTVITCAVLAAMIRPAVIAGGADPAGALAISVAVALGMILCVLVHEIAHALVAQAFGGTVDHIALTLWGGHTRYTSERLPGLRSAAVSLAGPASNLLLAAALWGMAHALPPAGPVGTTLAILAWLNTALALFNLLPGLPMDGGRALEGLLARLLGRPHRGTIVTAWIGRAIAIAVVALPLWRLTASSVSDTTALLAVVWGALIAAMLWNGAGSALAAARTQARIEDLSVGRFARRMRVLPPSAPVDAAEAGDLVLETEPGPRGQIGRAQLLRPEACAAVPAERRAGTPVSAVFSPLGTVGGLPPDLHGRAMLTHLLSYPHPAYLVLREGAAADAGAGAAGAAEEVRDVVLSADVNRFLRRG